MSERKPAEGVRIIKAEEAQAALEAGEAAGRRPDDQLRYGDVPPAPAGPRPAHRFPLPDSVNPAEAVSLPPLRGGAGRRQDAYAPPTGAPPTGAPATEAPTGAPATGAPATAATPAASPVAPDPTTTARFEPSPVAPPTPPTAQPSPPPTAPAPPPTAPSAAARPDIPPVPPPSGVVPAPPAPPRPPARFTPAPPDPAGGHRPVEADAPSWAAPTGWQETGPDRTTEMGVPSAGIPDEGITLSGSSAEMPHWSEPPTGEVPRLILEEDGSVSGGDDLEAWRALGSRGVRWRDEDDWDDADELSDLATADEPMGALDQTRTEHSDLYSFDEDFERVRSSRTGSHPVVDLTGDDDPDGDEADDWVPAAASRSGAARSGGQRRSRRSSGRPWDRARAAAPGRPRRSVTAAAAGSAPPAAPTPRVPRGAVPSADRPGNDRPGTDRSGRDRPGRRPPVRGGGDMGSRVMVGVGMIVVLAIFYVIGPKALVALSLIVVVAAAAEAYNMTRTPGFRPATLLGLVATVGCVLGAYWKGIGAIPVVTVLLFGGAMLWYVLGVVEARPLANVAVTVMVFVWVSVLGSFSTVLLQQRHGKGLFLGAVLVAVAADVGAFVVGRWIGSRPLAAHISPHKTVEGFVGGIVAALIVGAIIGKVVHPWSGMRYGLILGLVVGLIAPAGDLFESMLKRDLGIKDSGSILGGHGGLLDRFDGILLALPAAYFVATIAHI